MSTSHTVVVSKIKACGSVVSLVQNVIKIVDQKT